MNETFSARSASGATHPQINTLENVQPVPASGEILNGIMPYTFNGQHAVGYLTRRQKPGTAPMLVLLSDEHGIDQWLLGRAEGYAALGYVVVCPDLSMLEAGASDADVVADVSAAIDAGAAMLARPSAGPTGIIGFSSGGTDALTCARRMRLAMIVICYGPLVTTPDALLDVREPVLGIFGLKDPTIPKSDIDAFSSCLRQMGATFSGQIWRDEGHDFLRYPNDVEHAHEAEREIIKWLQDYLPTPQ